jgi:hypothetical protein
MSFICSICGQEYPDIEMSTSNPDTCLNCDLNLVHDANIEDSQLFSINI